MNAVMAIGTNSIDAITAVESRYCCVTTIAKLPLALEGKHVSIGRTVRFMAGGTALYEHRTVLKNKVTSFVGVTFRTLLLLEPAQRHAC